jgi:cobalamin biosynthesis protein CbiD
MVGSRNSIVFTHAGILSVLAMAIGIAGLSVAAQNVEQLMQRNTMGCGHSRQMEQHVRHRQQNEAGELDSSTGLRHLFTTIADKLAADAGDYGDAAAGGSAAACEARGNPDARGRTAGRAAS